MSLENFDKTKASNKQFGRMSYVTVHDNFHGGEVTERLAAWAKSCKHQTIAYMLDHDAALALAIKEIEEKRVH